MAASLVVSLERQGFATGLVTNGAIEGSKISRVPVARNSSTLPAILELLARLRPEAEKSITAVIQDSNFLPWGVSCVAFFHELDSNFSRISQYLIHRRIPALSIVSRQGGEEDLPAIHSQTKVMLCEDVRLETVQ